NFDYYKLNSINSFIEWKKGKKKIIFPIEPDLEKEYLSEDEKYYGIQGINPNMILIGKKDHSIIEENEYLPPSIISQSLQEQLMIIGKNPYFQDFKVERKYSEDKKYYIIEILQNEYQEDKNTSKKKENIFQYILKRKK
ncbi:MAG: hypothetical protein IKE70_04315, partial [Bacilli bacterium]|nr:hypothetical protein [Bacilli bacterium]